MNKDILAIVKVSLLQKLLFFCMVSIIPLMWHHESRAGIKSSTGSIAIDSDNDGNHELSLSTTQLSFSSNLNVGANVLVNGSLNIGGTNPLSTFEINGTMGHSLATNSANTTLGSNTYVLVNTATSNITLTLPYAGNVDGRLYVIKKVSANNHVKLNAGSDLIEAYSNELFLRSSANIQLPSVTMMSSSGNWWVVNGDSETLAYTNLWEPRSLSANILLWLDASYEASLTSVSGNLSTWSDISGQSNDATQSTDAAKPKTGVATLGGHNVVSFASGNYMELSNISSHQSVAVLYYDSGSNQYTTFLGTAYSGGGSYHGHSDTTQTFHATHTRTETRSGDNFRDGVDIGDGTGTARPTTWAIQTHSATQPFSATYQITKLGADNSSSASRSIVGAIAEVIVFDMPLSTSNREKIEGYLAWKWGLEASNLPGGHTYQFAAPQDF